MIMLYRPAHSRETRVKQSRLTIVLAAFAAFVTNGIVAQAQNPMDKPEFKVTLLGTGEPVPSIERFGPATLVQAGGLNLLFDCGRGCTQRLMQKGVPLGKIDVLFLTHLHSDHVVGIPDLLLIGWLRPPFAHRDAPMRVIGPVGTVSMMSNIEKAFEWDIKTRIADEKLPPAGVANEATDMRAGVVFEKNGVKVTTFEVNHGEKIKPAFGFRIDYDGRAVSISGDTKFNENLIQHSKGVDVLIHEVAAARPELIKAQKFLPAILAHHTNPEQAGIVFARVKPKLAVYYHLVLFGNREIKPYSPEKLVQLTRKTYSGPLVVGEDLMTLIIGKNEVQIVRK